MFRVGHVMLLTHVFLDVCAGDVSNVTCAILEVPYKQEENRLNERLRWILW